MLTIPLNLTTETYAVWAVGPHPLDKPGLALGPNQTVQISADKSVVTFSPDVQPKRDKDGVQSVASGRIHPVGVGGPAVVTVTILNGDGSLGESIEGTITVTAPVLPPGKPEASGDLFTVPISLLQKVVPQPAQTTAKPAPMPPAPKPVDPPKPKA